MKTRWIRIATLAGATLLFSTLGCTPQTQGQDLSGGIPSDLEQVFDKADDASGYTEVQSNEALYSAGLKKMICKLLKDKEGWPDDFFDTCSEQFQFTVETTKQSTVLGYLTDCQPVTVEMTVAVADASGGNSWRMRLSRAFNSDYNLRWEIKVLDSTSSQVDQYIQEWADSVGEYGTYEDADLGSWYEIAYREIPENIRVVAEAKRDAITAGFQEYRPQDGAEIAEDGHAAIQDESGEVVGYVISINYYIDDPLYDGGGVRLYYNLDGRLVVEVEWWG